ncbi:MAG: aspartate/glutamate racemase family protein [Candidatus Scalinduaceae bacterium]
MNNKKIIGIVGGVGPYASVDLTRKIFDQTNAKSDQDHLSIALLSIPKEIEDRTSYLLGQTSINPAYALFKIIRKLEDMGAGVVAIPCNTVHCPEIFDVIVKNLEKANSSIILLHMINKVAEFIRINHPQIRNVGVLCTTGTYKTKVYSNILEQKGINVIFPDEVLQDSIHTAIYDPGYGIKAQSNPVTEFAKRKLTEALNYLQKEGAEAIVLGCTEIPIAITNKKIGETMIIDPTLILARALIRELNPNKLKHYADK